MPFMIDPYRGSGDDGGTGTGIPVGPGYFWDAETGDMSGWTTTAGNPRVRDNQPNRHAPQGDAIYDGGTVAFSSCYQRIDLASVPNLSLASIDAGTTNIDSLWWGGTFEQGGNDQPQLSFIFRDSGLSELDTYDSGFKTPLPAVGGMRWDQYHENTDVPANTRYIDVVMSFQRNTGSNNDGAIDHIRISFIEE